MSTQHETLDIVYDIVEEKPAPVRHILSVLVDNEFGVLGRVIGLFSSRGYNIESLTVAEVENKKRLSRITIATSASTLKIQHIMALLERMVQTRPDDAFAHYGLAMEHRRLGNAQATVQAFEALIARFPAYVPSYLMYGQFLRDRGDLERARELFERGVTVAQQAGDRHAEGELRDAAAALGDP